MGAYVEVSTLTDSQLCANITYWRSHAEAMGSADRVRHNALEGELTARRESMRRKYLVGPNGRAEEVSKFYETVVGWFSDNELDANDFAAYQNATDLLRATAMAKKTMAEPQPEKIVLFYLGTAPEISIKCDGAELRLPAGKDYFIELRKKK